MEWLGLQNRSFNYLEAALILHSQNTRANTLSEPNYFLYIHTAELALKSFLVAAGTELAQIRSKFGHDLVELTICSVRNGLPLSADAQNFAKALQDLGGVIETKYFSEGLARRASPEQLKNLVTELTCVSALEGAKLKNFALPSWRLDEINNLLPPLHLYKNTPPLTQQ